MIKKIIFFNLLVLMFCYTTSVRPNKVVEAIDNLELDKIKKLLEKDNKFTKEEKEKMVAAIAETIKICKKSTKSMLESKTDLCRFVFGLLCIMKIGIPVTAYGLLGLLGSLALAAGSDGSDEANFMIGGAFISSGICTAIGAGALWLGVNQTRKGWNLHTANSRLKIARKIETLIEQYQPKEDNTVKKQIA